MENARSVVTPCSNDTELKEEKGEEHELENWQTMTAFRALAARLNYLAMDRPDLQYASNGISKFMSSPTPLGWRLLKRVSQQKR